MSYTVGQILYVVLRKEPNVYPMQVVEEITKKTLDGEITSYMVRAGKDATKVLPIAEVDGEIFDSAEAAKKTLIDRVSQAILHRVEKAVESAQEWYPSGFEHASDDPMAIIKKTVVSVDPMAVARAAKQQKRQMKPEVAELAAEFQAEANEAPMIEVPDGKGGVMMARINSVKVPPQMQG